MTTIKIVLFGLTLATSNIGFAQQGTGNGNPDLSEYSTDSGSAVENENEISTVQFRQSEINGSFVSPAGKKVMMSVAGTPAFSRSAEYCGSGSPDNVGFLTDYICKAFSKNGVTFVEREEDAEFVIKFIGSISVNQTTWSLTDILMTDGTISGNQNDAIEPRKYAKKPTSSAAGESIQGGLGYAMKTGDSAAGVAIAVVGTLFGKALSSGLSWLDESLNNEKNSLPGKTEAFIGVTVINMYEKSIQSRVVKPYMISNKPRMAEVLDAGFAELLKGFPTEVARINLAQLGVEQRETQAQEQALPEAPAAADNGQQQEQALPEEPTVVQ